MKYALVYLNEIKYDDLAWTFVANGIDAEIIDSGVSIDSTEERDILRISELLQTNSIDVAISMNFCPAISDACMVCNIIYFSWIYDSPQQALYSRQLFNNCNYIFSFDKKQTEEIKKLGGKNVFYLPLATNTIRNSRLSITSEDIKRFSCDISFAGSMYIDNYYEVVESHSSEKLKEEMTGIIENAYGKWDGIDRLCNKLSSEALEELDILLGAKDNPVYLADHEKYIASKLFSVKLANMERVGISRKLGKMDFRLYTTSKEFYEPGVQIFQALSYEEELPKLYHLSKINLNITLHSIQSGVPLRVFDIMGVGGFVLTNYQPEIEELFKVGEEIEVFHTIDELEDKAKYYIMHENKRLHIALNGYKTVIEKYSYDKQFTSMCNMAFGHD